ncbi:hypothetical protein SASPL_131149 [Salvia splendens]|uniref:Protein kinase domain-containing protein n=1 Tax=Salvia splendens TaxID=180675 RepID=A0A8X8ZKK8_SALSN|nr:hypothetical protein SASPL_131149 [Salvia splendens]
MADVVTDLESALKLQQTTDPTEEEENGGRTSRDHRDGVNSMDGISFPKEGIDKTTIEDNPSSSITIGDSDQKNGKKKAATNNLTQRWWWDPFGILPRKPSKLKPQEVIHQFSFKEIQKATNNFHNNLMIGYGGQDKLQTKKEIQRTPSPLQYHVVSLIGYCETEPDMILVYKHTENGTLYDHLHYASKDPLPWKRRLEICIGAIRGLRFIHSIVQQAMLHRDLKSTNIWLDENWIPKGSGWGLSKKKGNNQVQSIIRSNWGHLDSDYVHGKS